MKASIRNDETAFGTRIDISAESREQVVELLNETLASLSDLYSQTKYAHWNVKGPNFIGIHKLCDEVAESVEEAVDEVAERITALGGIAYGTVRQAAASSGLDDFPADSFDSSEVIAILADRFGHTANSCRRGIDVAMRYEDPGTADLLTQTGRMLDKSLYFLSAHEQ